MDFKQSKTIQFNQGDHISCIYKTKDQMYSLVVPFFIDGLEKRNKCIFINEEGTNEEVINAFDNVGFNLQPYIDTKDFMFLSANDLYLKNSKFNPDNVITDLINFETEALKQNYSGLRVAGDASWSLKPPKSMDELIQYEARVSDFIKYSFIIAVCLYKESLYEKSDLSEVIYTHPFVYIYDKFVTNRYFKTLSTLNTKTIEEQTYEQLVDKLYNL